MGMCREAVEVLAFIVAPRPIRGAVDVSCIVKLPVPLHLHNLSPSAAMVAPVMPCFAPVHQDERKLEPLRRFHHAAKESVPVAATPIYPFRFRCHHEYSIPMLGHQVMERRPAQV